MKKILISMLAVAALVSCSKEESIRVDQGEAIEFGNAFVDNATRADDATDPSYSTTTGKGVALTSFNVYGAVNGVNIFNGNLVEKNADYGAAWKLTGNKQYWIAGADYEFVAVVDGNKAGVTVTHTDADSGIPTSIDYTVDGATDLLCASVVRLDNTNTSIVGFDFEHLLSKVKFSVENTSEAAATNYRIVLTSAKITGVYESGAYGVAARAWTATDTTDFVLENLTVASAATQFNSKEILLIPGKNVGVYVKANIEVTDDAGAHWTVVSEVEKTFTNVLGDGKTLVANNAYHFAVSLGIGTEIQFTATEMPDWNEQTEMSLQKLLLLSEVRGLEVLLCSHSADNSPLAIGA